MREPTFTLLFIPLLILAFFPDLFGCGVRLPLLVLSTLVTKLIASVSPSSSLTTASVARIPSSPRLPIAPTATTILTTTTTPTSTAAAAAVAPTIGMSWFQKTLTLPSRSRGSYLITSEVEGQLPELSGYKVGILHLFLQHTSAALSLNENWDEDVRADMSDALDRIVPEDKGGRAQQLYRHAAEGSDDMPAHVKSALVGASVTIPIRDGRLATGTWQGIWFLEFRRAKHSRKVVATIQGEKM